MPKRKKAVEEIYQKKSPREHVLLRPDTYVGSVEKDQQKMFVLDFNRSVMVEEEIEFVPALYKIFDEILVNAADNKQRDSSMSEIRVTIDKLNGWIQIKNDGKGIPVEIHKEHNMYVPELIFGNLLTSSNYNDRDLKTVGGRNGFGAKLANIFSNKFVVETVDNENLKKYQQKWKNNMSLKEDPHITDLSSRSRVKDYTKVTFWPDFQRFSMNGFDDDIIKLFVKRVYDIAGTTSKDLKVHLVIKYDEDDDNEVAKGYDNVCGALKIRTFIDYSKLFIGSDVRLKQDYFHAVINDSWEIILAISPDNEYRQITHVNNIWTIKGGSHVKYIENQFIKYFRDNFKSKLKKMKELLKPQMIRTNLFVFINCLIINPSFSSQTKEILTTKSSAFGSTAVIPVDINRKLMKKITEIVKDLIAFKLEQSLKKSDGKSYQSRLQLPPEIDDANDAGTRLSSECTLIVTEGLSAKTLAVAGISELPGNKNKFGIFPLKGKLLNVRDATLTNINKNAEITNLKKILGLKHGVKYDNDAKYRQLRYGRVMIMTDQDYDGSHIKGLMINFFHSMWPELITHRSFLQQFITPIVVAKKGKGKKQKVVQFYTIPEYEKWRILNNNGRGWKIKYYKGLGTWQRADGKEHFRNLKQNQITFKYNNDCNEIVKAFDKKKTDLRKEWISNYEEGTHINFNTASKAVTYSEFVNNELILFSVNDLRRSIPSIYDGLKPGQRKILYCCFLKGKFTREIRVAQLGGYVSEKSSYHHGETSLYQTIIGMAQDFVGSNNINLLQPNGMFGSRIRGGKDSASPRYIHTHLSPITRYIFKNDDDLCVEYQEDDGYPIEPKYYIPILPVVLINGAEGIGTGWSTFIPNYNPSDIIRNIRKKLLGEEWENMIPYYRGYRGELNRNKDANINGYRTYGKCEIIDTKTIVTDAGNKTVSTLQVTELPIRVWTESFKKYLMDLEFTEQIENVNNMSSDIDVAFTFDVEHRIRPKKGVKRKNKNSNSSSPISTNKNIKKIRKKIYFNGVLDDDFLKSMKLSTSIPCSNMVLFDIYGKIKKYNSVSEILSDFYDARLKLYSKRKKILIKNMEFELKKLSNQTRFIMMIINDKLTISKKKKIKIVKELNKLNFDLWKEEENKTNTLKDRAKATNENEEEDKDTNDDDDMDIDYDLDDSDDDDVDMNNNNNNKYSIDQLMTGYNYLLNMRLSSLTKEQVDKLLNNQEIVEKKLHILQQKSAKDLWREDLDELEKYLNIYNKKYNENINEMRKQAKVLRNKNQKTTKKKRKKRVYTKKTTKSKSKSKSVSSSTKSSSISTSTTTTTTTTANKTTKKITKKIKKTLKPSSNNNNLVSDPWSMSMSKKKKKIKKKVIVSSSDNFDDDFDASPPAILSFSERARLKKKNSPKKNKINPRKRKHNIINDDNDSDLLLSSSSSIDIIREPPKKKHKSKSSSISINSSSNSNSILKSINKNKKKKKKNY